MSVLLVVVLVGVLCWLWATYVIGYFQPAGRAGVAVVVVLLTLWVLWVWGHAGWPRVP